MVESPDCNFKNNFMKSILFHIGSFQLGGAEKSLVTLLNSLPKGIYDIDVLVSKKDGVFISDVPEDVNIIEAPFPYKCLSVPFKNVNWYFKFPIKYWLVKLIAFIYSKFCRKLSTNQSIWKFWRKYIPVFGRKYDIALSYIEGITNYFIIDKVNAARKILWMHTEYSKLNYDSDFDYCYFSKADAVVTISNLCKENLVGHFPDLKNKFHVIENLSNSRLIINKSHEIIQNVMFDKCHGAKLLSVGRLTKPKNFTLLLYTALELKRSHFDYSWIVIGEGEMRNELETLARKLDVNENVKFIGFRNNPYSYMALSDIIVMTSLFEGKSIVIDEAKILCKPIVSVNYPTVKDNIEDHVTGIITEMTPESLAKGIIKLYNDDDLRKELQNNLMTEVHRGDDQINHYLKLFE